MAKHSKCRVYDLEKVNKRDRSELATPESGERGRNGMGNLPRAAVAAAVFLRGKSWSVTDEGSIEPSSFSFTSR